MKLKHQIFNYSTIDVLISSSKKSEN